MLFFRVLTFYLCQRFTLAILSTIFGLFIIILLANFLELLRATADKPDISFLKVAYLGLLKTPSLLVTLVPICIFIGCLTVFWQLNRRSEVVILRGLHLSIWRILTPIVLTCFAIGVITVTILQPLGAYTQYLYEQNHARLINQSDPLSFSFGTSGLWLKQSYDDGRYDIVHVQQVDNAVNGLKGISIYQLSAISDLTQQIDAVYGVIKKDVWSLYDVTITSPGTQSLLYPSYDYPTHLTLEAIQKQFKKADQLGFWDFAKTLKSLQQTGFPTRDYKLWWQRLWALPFFGIVLCYLAAACTLQPIRQGFALLRMGIGITLVFVVTIVGNILAAQSLSYWIPVEIAIWGPVFFIGLIAITGLVYYEEG